MRCAKQLLVPRLAADPEMELLEQWLNEELPLSRSVSSVEDAFTNGYLLGETLHIFNQQNDFGDFQDKDSAKARLRNFCLLEPTIRYLKRGPAGCGTDRCSMEIPWISTKTP